MPPAVYRFFENEWEADALVAGKVWVGTLSYYRQLEHRERGDRGEGLLTYGVTYAKGDGDDPAFVEQMKRVGIELGPGAKNTVVTNSKGYGWIPDAWALCTTLRNSADAMRTLGTFCVEITQLIRFHAALTQTIHKVEPLEEAVMGPVIYAEREYRDDAPAPGPTGFVKPPDRYREQQEFRFLYTPARPRQLPRRTFECPDIRAFVRRI